MTKIIEITGQRFGKLVVLKRAISSKCSYLWLCQCDCGNLTTVRGACLRTGRTRSCGCLKRKPIEDLSYGILHSRLRESKPKPKLCQRCKERPAEELSYNNKSEKEGSRDPNNYEWLCIRCHRSKDLGQGAILTEARIRKIRELYACKTASQRELAILFKVSHPTIGSIIHYKGAYKRPTNPEIFKELVRGLEVIE